MIPKILIGDAVRLRHLEHFDEHGNSFRFSPPPATRRKKDQRVFVCVLLGTEPLLLDDPEEGLDIKGAMKDLNWVVPGDAEKKLAQALEVIEDASQNPNEMLLELEQILSGLSMEEVIKRNDERLG